jgi:hypothetical protein
MGGDDSPENIITLTYKEHFLAHYLLAKMYPKEVKVQYAFSCMIRKHNHGRDITGKMYDTVKKNFSNFMKWHIQENNPGRTEKARESSRKRMTEMNSQPIRIHFIDGTINEYQYIKEYCNESGASYDAILNLSRNNKRSEKYGILRIERLKKR